jgi:hypothetical protein
VAELRAVCTANGFGQLEQGRPCLSLRFVPLSHPRESVSNNSTPTGYLSIHLLGLCIGTKLVPPSPNYFRRQLQQANSSHSRVRAASSPPSAFQRQDDKTATELCAYAVVWWAGFAVVRLLGLGGDVSRRMVSSWRLGPLSTIARFAETMTATGESTIRPLGSRIQQYLSILLPPPRPLLLPLTALQIRLLPHIQAKNHPSPTLSSSLHPNSRAAPAPAIRSDQ